MEPSEFQGRWKIPLALFGDSCGGFRDLRGRTSGDRNPSVVVVILLSPPLGEKRYICSPRLWCPKVLLCVASVSLCFACAFRMVPQGASPMLPLRCVDPLSGMVGSTASPQMMIMLSHWNEELSPPDD